MDVLDQQHRRAAERDFLDEPHRRGVQLLPRVERVELGSDVQTEGEREDLTSLEAARSSSADAPSRSASCSRTISPSGQ